MTNGNAFNPAGPTGVTLLRWPWSSHGGGPHRLIVEGLEAECEWGAPLLCAPKAMKIFPLGTRADIVPLSMSGEGALYELPQVNAVSEDASLALRCSINREHSLRTIRLVSSVPRFLPGRQERVESDESLAVVRWTGAFDDLAQKGRESDGAIYWDTVLKWLGAQAGSDEPRMALIVEIAQNLELLVRQSVHHMRRVLLDQREIVPIRDVRRTDHECLRWYIRQPGETIVEKMGHRQELMSVVRRETFDTLENRVLKDFLKRAILAGSQYLRGIESNQKKLKRPLLVRRFSRLCSEALELPAFQYVSQVDSSVKPNYVLEQDLRYKKVWQWYQKLLRSQNAEDDAWTWQNRLWADVCRLLIGAACSLVPKERKDRPTKTLSGLERGAQAPFLVESENRHGRRLENGWGPGPILYKPAGRHMGLISVVSSEDAYTHPLVEGLGALGAHAFVIWEPLEDAGEPTYLEVVWAINTLASSRPLNAQACVSSAESAVERGREQLRNREGRKSILCGGVICASALGKEVGEIGPAPVSNQDAGVQVNLYSVGANPACWDEMVLGLAVNFEERWKIH